MLTNFSIENILRGTLQTFSSDPPSGAGDNASLGQHLTIINNAARQGEPTPPLCRPANAYSLQANDSLRHQLPPTPFRSWGWLVRKGENERFEITSKRCPPPAVNIPIKRNDAATLRAIIFAYGQEEKHKGKTKQILNLVMDDIIASRILNPGSLPQSAPHPPDPISTKTSNTGIGLQQDSSLSCHFGVDTITMPGNKTYKLPNECQLAYLMAVHGLQRQGYKYLAFIENKFLLNLGPGKLQGKNKEIFEAWVSKINELILSKKIFLLWPHKTYKNIAVNIRKIAPFLQHKNTAVDLGWLLRAAAEQRNKTVVTCPKLAKKDTKANYHFAIRHFCDEAGLQVWAPIQGQQRDQLDPSSTLQNSSEPLPEWAQRYLGNPLAAAAECAARPSYYTLQNSCLIPDRGEQINLAKKVIGFLNALIILYGREGESDNKWCLGIALNLEPSSSPAQESATHPMLDERAVEIGGQKVRVPFCRLQDNVLTTPRGEKITPKSEAGKDDPTAVAQLTQTVTAWGYEPAGKQEKYLVLFYDKHELIIADNKVNAEDMQIIMGRLDLAKEKIKTTHFTKSYSTFLSNAQLACVISRALWKKKKVGLNSLLNENNRQATLTSLELGNTKISRYLNALKWLFQYKKVDLTQKPDRKRNIDAVEAATSDQASSQAHGPSKKRRTVRTPTKHYIEPLRPHS